MIRGSGPNQKHAFVSRVAHNRFSQINVRLFRIMSYSPLQSENATGYMAVFPIVIGLLADISGWLGSAGVSLSKCTLWRCLSPSWSSSFGSGPCQTLSADVSSGASAVQATTFVCTR